MEKTGPQKRYFAKLDEATALYEALCSDYFKQYEIREEAAMLEYNNNCDLAEKIYDQAAANAFKEFEKELREELED